MLKEKYLNEASNLVTSLKYSNRNATPKPGTPLAVLVGTLGGFNDDGTDRQIIQQSQNTTSVEGNHTMVTKQISGTSSKIIGNIINNARNVITPIIRDVIRDVEERRESELDDAIHKAGAIVQIEMNPLFVDDSFQSLIANYTTNVNTDSSIYSVIDKIKNYFTTAEIDDLMVTGSSLLDGRVKSFTDEIDQVWFYDLETPSSNKVSVNIKLFMILNGILTGRSDKADSITNDTSDEYKLQTIKADVGSSINKYINNLTKTIDNGDIVAGGNLIPKYPNDGVFVIGKNYRTWVNDGGSPEAVLGYNIVSENRYSAILAAKMKDNPGEMTKHYEAHLNNVRITQNLNDVKLVRVTIQGNISKVISSKDVSDNDKELLYKKLKDALTIEYYGNTVMVAYIREVVCKTFDDGDDSLLVLVEIDNAIAMMDKPNLKEAIFQATAKLIGRWIGQQMIVERD